MPTKKLDRPYIIFGAALALCTAILPTQATVLDPFESTVGWNTVTDAAGATVSLSTVTGQSGNALRMTYSLEAGHYAGIYNNSAPFVDFTALGADAVQFRYRATGGTNTIEIKFVDSDSGTTILADNLMYKFTPVTDNVWREMTVPFASFFTNDFGNSSFDLSRVSKFGFGVSRDTDAVASEGSIYFDGFRLVQASSRVSVIDSAEGPNPLINDRSGPQSIIVGATPSSNPHSFLPVTTEVHRGSYSRQFDCTLPSGYCFASHILGKAVAQGDEAIEFWIKGVPGNGPLRIQLKSTEPVHMVEQTVTGISTTEFTKLSYPLASFKAINPALNFSALTEIVFVFNTVGTHRVYLDDLALVGPAGSGETVRVLDDFSALPKAPYITAAPLDTSTVALTSETDPSVVGLSGATKVARLDYSFSSEPGQAFSVAEKDFVTNLLKEPMVRFSFRGTGGNSDIEVKLVDEDGTVYRKVLADASNTEGVWKTVSLPVDQFSFFALGADANLNLVRIPQMEFILARGEAAAGTLDLDLLESVSPPAVSKPNLGRVLASVSTPDNPFTPNGDGLKDIFRVDYTLSQQAAVVFRVFNLQGVPVKTLDLGSQSAGDLFLTWDGVGDNGERVANGVYFFVLDADGLNAGKDTFKQIVGVMR
ncbi:MAG: gliding motility-associated C-terminal domain-containing protein [Elusimicrobia bacterium]|nr:gliding motility-associated C-terminal domain-containing protein [Elusimicrobiota bacterium]